MEQMWAEVKRILSNELTETCLKTWFSDCRIADIRDSVCIIIVPDEFRRTVMVRRFQPAIRHALQELLCADYELKMLLPDETDQCLSQQPSVKKQTVENTDYTFDRFIVGESNRLAYTAAAKIAAGKDSRMYNPLFVYGNSGLGKTHLLNAILNAVTASNPDKNVVYCRCEDFTNQMIRAIQEKKMEEFRKRYRQADYLLLDDIEFIAGKPSTQEEFFNTFCSIYESGGHIVLTSDRPPKDLSTLETRLRTRFESGIIAELGAPDLSMRKQFISETAKEFSCELSEENIACISEALTANFRQLKGAVKSICAYYDLNGSVTRECINRVLSSVTVPGSPRITSDRIIKETARYFSVEEKQIRGSSRERKPSAARQAAMYLCQTMLTMTLSEIGAEFGKRDHATVMASVRKAKAVSETDSIYSEALRNIRLNLTMG